MRVMLDTNIILRNAHTEDPQHQPIQDALDRLLEKGWELCIADQNVYEFWVVATRPEAVNGFGLDPDRARREIELILKAYTIIPVPSDLRDRWLNLCIAHAVLGRKAHDVRIVALMQAHGVQFLLTLNRSDFDAYPGITVLTPADV